MHKILILAGSSSHSSHTLSLSKNIKQKLESLNTKVYLIDLIEYKLPQYDLSLEKESYVNDPKVMEFMKLTKECNGYIWGSPVYHGSYSGILKNALDWQHMNLKGKIAGLISNGNQRGSMVVDHLTLVARTQHAIPIPTRVCTHRTDYDENKKVSSPDILSRIDTFCSEFTDFLDRFKN
jgi:NAD(P)H-dependent FMN reductase